MASGARTGHKVSMPFGARSRWLRHPGFLGCVAVLALNDHLFKARYPGWWTGKLSDLAGVAVVATVAAVVVGPRRGLPLVAAAFVLLKTVPGVAAVASPLLGGETARDATDLLALVILLPLGLLLAADAGPAGAPVEEPHLRVRGPREIGRRCRAGLAAAGPVIGAILAVGTATATSCSPGPAVIKVAAQGGDLFALVTNGYGEPGWARSRDGGTSWEGSAAPRGMPAASPVRDPYQDPGPEGPLDACTPDDTCWRLRDQRVIERRSPGTDWVQEVRLSERAFFDISTGCLGSHVGVFGSIAATEGHSAPRVVASLGAEGVLTRQRDGTWREARVLSAPPL